MIYDERGNLTRAGAIQVISEGGSVSFGDRVFATVDKLPSDAEFAKGNVKQEDEARKRLQQTITDAQSQLKTLEPAKHKYP